MPFQPIIHKPVCSRFRQSYHHYAIKRTSIHQRTAIAPSLSFLFFFNQGDWAYLPLCDIAHGAARRPTADGHACLQVVDYVGDQGNQDEEDQNDQEDDNVALHGGVVVVVVVTAANRSSIQPELYVEQSEDILI